MEIEPAFFDSLWTLISNASLPVQIGAAFFVVMALLGVMSLFRGSKNGASSAAGSGRQTPVHQVHTLTQGYAFKTDTLDKAFIRSIQTLLRQDKKIEAIKIYREKTSTSLADAKHAVEE